MSTLVDLTLTLGGPRLTPVPGLPGVEFAPVHTHEVNYRSNTQVVMATHVGTHVDAPYHFIPDGATVDEMPLEKFMGPGVLVDLRGMWERKKPVTAAMVKATGVAEADLRDKIVVLFSGWVESEFGKPWVYSDNPFIGKDLAELLVRAQVRAVGVDFAVDETLPGPPQPTHFPIHRILLGAGIPLIENLVNLGSLVGRRFEVWALPVKFYKGDGGAARVVARLLD